MIRQLAATACVAAVAHAQVPEVSNRHLIALMPPGTESVFVLRPPDIDQKSPFHTVLDLVPELHADAVVRRDELLGVVRRGVIAADVVALAIGGSCFRPPEGIGAGEFNGRAVYITKEPLDALRRQLENRDGIAGLHENREIAGIKVYAGSVHVFDGRFETVKELLVAVSDSRMLVLSETHADMAFMLTAIPKKPNAIPDRWRQIAESLDLASPVLVLRCYDKDNRRDGTSPWGLLLNGKPVEVESAGAALNASDNSLRLEARTSQRREAERFYMRSWFLRSHFEWQTTDTDEGFRSTLHPRPGKNPGEISLPVLMFFGFDVAI